MGARRRSLGRGLDALLGSEPGAARAFTGDRLQELPIDLLERGRYQPRVDMRPESLEELAASIRAQGLVQPIIVRPLSASGESAEHAGTLDRLRSICARHEVPIGIHCYDGASALTYLDEGFQMVTAGMDSGMLRDGAMRHLAAARAQRPEDRSAPGY